jgi:hypothetical protein
MYLYDVEVCTLPEARKSRFVAIPSWTTPAELALIGTIDVSSSFVFRSFLTPVIIKGWSLHNNLVVKKSLKVIKIFA